MLHGYWVWGRCEGDGLYVGMLASHRQLPQVLVLQLAAGAGRLQLNQNVSDAARLPHTIDCHDTAVDLRTC